MNKDVEFFSYAQTWWKVFENTVYFCHVIWFSFCQFHTLCSLFYCPHFGVDGLFLFNIDFVQVNWGDQYMTDQHIQCIITYIEHSFLDEVFVYSFCNNIPYSNKFMKTLNILESYAILWLFVYKNCDKTFAITIFFGEKYTT